MFQVFADLTCSVFIESARMALCDAGYFGPAPDLQAHFDQAYASFRAFTKANKITCTQPPFKVRSVA